jgi:class 3 adenylate cyclase
VNLAARIASHASAGELLVLAEVVNGATEAGFECKDVGEVSLKGLEEPVHLARVLAGPRQGRNES